MKNLITTFLMIGALALPGMVRADKLETNCVLMTRKSPQPNNFYDALQKVKNKIQEAKNKIKNINWSAHKKPLIAVGSVAGLALIVWFVGNNAEYGFGLRSKLGLRSAGDKKSLFMNSPIGYTEQHPGGYNDLKAAGVSRPSSQASAASAEASQTFAKKQAMVNKLLLNGQPNNN